MRILSINNNTQITYKAVKLNNAQFQESKMLLSKLALATEKESMKIKNRLYDILNKHVLKECEEKCQRYQHFDDFIQEMYLKIFEMVEDIRNSKLMITAEEFFEKINEIKIRQNVLKERVRERSLDENFQNQNESPASFVTDEHLPVYSKPRTDEERVIIREKLKNLIYSARLNDTISECIKAKSKGKSVQKIADEIGLSYITTYKKITKGIAKIQDENNILPERYDILTNKLLEKVKDKSLAKKIKQVLIKNPVVVTQDEKDLFEKIKKSSKLLGLDESEYIKCALNNVLLFYQNPETLNKNVEVFCKLVNLDKKTYVKSAKLQPTLFSQDPLTLKNKLEMNSKSIGISIEEFISLCLEAPRLFHIANTLIKEKFDYYIKELNINKSTLANLIKTYPIMLCADKENTVKKIHLYEYYKNYRKEKNDKLVYYSNTIESLYKKILLHLLQKHYGRYNINRHNMIEKIKSNPDAKYSFRIAEGSFSQDLIKYVDDFFKKELGKSSVEYKVEKFD